jgi:molybdate transport system substrate-binding protein
VKRVLLAALVLPLALTACAADDDDAQATITVSAAASLTDAFAEIGDAFMQANPEVRIRFNFAGSSTLAAQINAGAPVDVFAAASMQSMQATLDAGSIRNPQNFAANQLAIVVPRGNPAGIIELADLQNSDVTLVTCDARVPCGAATNALFDKNGLSVTSSSLEPDVRAVLTKVIADEADAGIVYRTDVFAAGDQVEVIEIEDDNNVINTYPIALTTQAKNGSQAFVDFVLSDEGQDILRTWGFESP